MRLNASHTLQPMIMIILLIKTVHYNYKKKNCNQFRSKGNSLRNIKWVEYSATPFTLIDTKLPSPLGQLSKFFMALINKWKSFWGQGHTPRSKLCWPRYITKLLSSIEQVGYNHLWVRLLDNVGVRGFDKCGAFAGTRSGVILST